MATREENLKKINDELEKLDDDQLDKVVGGLDDTFWDCLFNKQNTEQNITNNPVQIRMERR